MPSLGLLPDTLRGRLTLLLVLAVLASHVLALSLMFELRPQPPQRFFPVHASSLSWLRQS